jgi:small-conductance mechanosensitive channel/CRP-like cAMP-binding protein
VTTIAADLAWLGGLAIGAGGTLLGAFVLRTLWRRRVPWWRSLAAPLLLFGPALGLVFGTWSAGGEFTWGRDSAWTTNLGWSLLFFVGATTVFELVRDFLESRVVAEQMGLKIPVLILDVIRWLLWIGMLFVVVGAVWEKTEWFSALFTASAVGTVILGLALQETLTNFFAGIGIVSERTYHIGDWVWLGDEEGEVVHISRRTTKIRTRLNDIVTMPNRMVATNKVRNQSQPDFVHAEMVYVNAPYRMPPNRMREVLKGAVLEVPGVLHDPPPVFRVHEFADSYVRYQVKVFLVDLARIPDILSDTRIRIWYHLHREGISVPYPVRELRRRGVGGTGGATEALVLHDRLRSVALFRPLSEELLTVLVNGARVIEYGAGERIVQQGDTGDTCYVVDRGSLAVLVKESGVEQRVADLREGDLFGEMSLLTGAPRSATVRALTDTRIVSVGAKSLQEVLTRSPELATALAEVVAKRQHGLDEAKAVIDDGLRHKIDSEKHRLGHLIRQFFRL